MQSLLNQFKRTLNRFSLMQLIDPNWFLNQFSWNWYPNCNETASKSIRLILVWISTLSQFSDESKIAAPKTFYHLSSLNILIEPLNSAGKHQVCLMYNHLLSYLNTPITVLLPGTANSKVIWFPVECFVCLLDDYHCNNSNITLPIL